MKAIGKLKREKGLWMYDAEMPKIGDNEVLIKVIYSAICGTDVHIYKYDDWAQKTIPVPMTVGHEFVGIVEKVGKNARRIKVGDRVSGEGHIVCGVCQNCRSGRFHFCPNTVGVGVHRTGAFAEYVAIPEFNVVKIPEKVSSEEASILDPLGNTVYTTLAFPITGRNVLISGCGPIGMMACAVARFAGAKNIVVTDINDFRLSMGKKMGATRTVNVSKETLFEVAKELSLKEGFDVGLEMSGNKDALGQLVNFVINGGSIALLGLVPDGSGLNWSDFIFKSLTLKGIYGRQMFDTWYEMLNMLESGLDVKSVITHIVKAQDFEKGFAAILDGKAAKVLLDWR